MFVLDSSGSVGPEDFELEKQFAANVVKGLEIGEESSNSRLGACAFVDIYS